MTDLTEQFKKGELKLGEHYYYTTIFSPTVHIQNFTRDVTSSQDFKETVAEVLAPVPSYEEWQATEKRSWLVPEFDNEIDELNDTIEELQKENTKLKELLKDCRRQFEEVALYRYDVADDDQEDWFKISTEQAGIANKMITKIDQALGEDK